MRPKKFTKHQYYPSVLSLAALIWASTFSLSQNTLQAQVLDKPNGDTLVFDSSLITPNFWFNRNASQWTDAKDAMPIFNRDLSESWMVPYAPGQKVLYPHILTSGIYFSALSSIHQFMHDKQADSLRNFYPRTTWKSNTFEKSTIVGKEDIKVPVSRYWKKVNTPVGFYLLHATFKYIYVGFINVKIPDLKYRMADRGKKPPVITVRVPAYFITEFITIDGKAQP